MQVLQQKTWPESGILGKMQKACLAFRIEGVRETFSQACAVAAP
jgi:hypothetical protein